MPQPLSHGVITNPLSLTEKKFVEEGEQVTFYRDAYGQVQRRVALTEKNVDSGVDVEKPDLDIEL